MSKIKSTITIGWFGLPGKQGGKTHYARDGKPLCGTRMMPNAEYQWCFPNICGEVECKRCNKLAIQLLQNCPIRHKIKTI
jgi:hypothetical protein